MSHEDQTLKCYSDDQWWELQDDHRPHDHHDQLLLLNYQIIAAPPDHHDHVGHDHKLLASAPQYPQTFNTQYPNSSTSHVSPDNLMKPPGHVTSPAKPKRRRGRGGSTTTTTFLNSTITNFRELVQQHTGMSTTPTTSSSSYYASCNQKGPITLCFANYSSPSSTSESAHEFNHNRNQ